VRRRPSRKAAPAWQTTLKNLFAHWARRHANLPHQLNVDNVRRRPSRKAAPAWQTTLKNLFAHWARGHANLPHHSNVDNVRRCPSRKAAPASQTTLRLSPLTRRRRAIHEGHWRGRRRPRSSPLVHDMERAAHLFAGVLRAVADSLPSAGDAASQSCTSPTSMAVAGARSSARRTSMAVNKARSLVLFTSVYVAEVQSRV
jgi:hypothetical protein